MTRVQQPYSRSMSCMIERRAFSEIFYGAEWAKIIRNPQCKGKKSQWWSFDCLARVTSKELAPIHSVKVTSSSILVLQVRKWMQNWEEVLLWALPGWRNSSAKGLRSIVTQVQWLCWKITRPLGYVFQGMDPPKSSSVLRRNSFLRKPIRYVRFTDAVGRHANIRDQNPSLGMICPADPHQRHPNAPKFEDRSQEETEWQERCAREAARKFAKHILKFKETNKTAFFSLSETRCLPASSLNPEEREIVVDSGASMHMISKKFLSDAEMDSHHSQWRSADAWRGCSLS